MVSKKEIRPIIDSEPSQNQEEHFQNETIRPILKLQHELLVLLFEKYLLKRKQSFEGKSASEISKYINASLKNDHQLKSLLLGFVIGLFTYEELKLYYGSETSLNKRIIAMIIQRLESVFCKSIL